jgi:hypothetical protein
MNTYLVANGVATLRVSDAQAMTGLALGGDSAPAATLRDVRELLAQVQAHPACVKLVFYFAGSASADGSLVLAGAAGQPAPLTIAALAGLLQPLANRGVHLTMVLDAPLPSRVVDAFAGYNLQGVLLTTSSATFLTRGIVLAAARPFGQDPFAALPAAAKSQGLQASPFSPTPLAVPAASVSVAAAFAARATSVAVVGTYTLLSPSVTPCGSAPASYAAPLQMRVHDGLFLLFVPSDDNAINPGTLNADGSFSTARDGETYRGVIDASGAGSATDTYGYNDCTWTYHVTLTPAAG